MNIARLAEYAEMMPKEDWGWVAPRPGGRPLEIRAGAEVLARGVEFPAAEYFGLLSPDVVLALVRVALAAREVGHGLAPEWHDGERITPVMGQASPSIQALRAALAEVE